MASEGSFEMTPSQKHEIDGYIEELKRIRAKMAVDQQILVASDIKFQVKMELIKAQLAKVQAM